MKRKFILALSLFFTMSLSVSAFAAENTTATTENTTATENYKSYAGITPGSIFYSLDEALDNLSVKLASTPSDKIEKLIEIERERLGEVQTLIDSKKVDLGVNTLDALKTLADQTSTQINSILNDSTTTEDGTKNTDTAIKDAEDFNAASSIALDKLKDKLPENAAKKVAAVAEMQSAKKAAVQQMVSARHELNTAKKALADATKSGDTAAIEKAKADLAAANTSLVEKKTAFDNAKKNKSEVIKNEKVGKGHKTQKDDSTATAGNTTNSSETTTNTSTSTNTSGTTTSSTTAPENNTTATSTENSNTSITTEITPEVAPNTTITKQTTTTEVSKDNDEKVKEHKINNGNSDKHKNENKKNDNKKGK